MRKKQASAKNKLRAIYDRLFRALGPQSWWPGETPFEVAVGAILTQNTSWGNVEKAIASLKREKRLSAKAMTAMPSRELARLIRPAGYFNIKTKRLKSFLRFLNKEYRGSMERMKHRDTALLRKALLEVNGIGPETADSILLYALERPVFVIDAYTRRILERHGITHSGSTYHELQELFHRNLPPDTQLFNEFHALIVMTGKDFCRTKPRCGTCPLRPLLPRGTRPDRDGQ